MKIKGLHVKLLLIAGCCVMMVFSMFQGTMAWLMTQTDPIVNVFTYGDIQIELKETTGDRYKMTPGKAIEKDPKLTVKAQSEDCWLFVKIDESSDKKLSDYIKYEIAEGWEALSTAENVFYRSVDMNEGNQEFEILKNNKVKVKSSVTNDMLDGLNDSNYPTLTFTGYAVQRDAEMEEIDTAEEAWSLLQ